MNAELRLDQPDAGSIWRVLKRRKRTIFASVGVFLVLGLAADVFIPSVYRATVRLEIRRPAERSPLTGQTLGSPSYQSENLTMLTAAGQITNRRLLAQVASDFDARGWIRAIPTVAWKGNGHWSLMESARAATRPAGQPGDAVDPALRDAQVDWLESVVSVEPVQDTRLVDVRVEHRNPQAALAIADRLAERFVNESWRHSVSADTSGLLYLNAELAVMRNRIQASGGPGDVAGLGRLSALQTRIQQATETVTELSGERLRAHADWLAARARVEKLAHAADTDPVPGGSPVLQETQRDLQACQEQLAAARQVYGPKHPKLIQLEAQLAALKGVFGEQRASAMSGLRAEEAVLAARDRGLKSALDRSEAELSAAQEEARRLGPLSSNLKTTQDLYDQLAARVQEGRIEGLMKAPPVEIVDAATLDPAPVRPRRLLNLAVALLTGLLVGTGLAFFRESGRRTIQAPQEVEDKLDLPLVGVIPKQD